MTKLISIGSFVVTPEMLLPLAMLGGFLIVFGAKRLAGALFILILLAAFAPLIEGVISDLLAMFPPWVAWVIIGAFVWSMFRWIAELVLGREGAGTLVGNLATMAVLALLRAPFNMLGGLFRIFLRR